MPLIQRYWMRQGKMTIDQLASNSYLQAVNDMVDAGFVLLPHEDKNNAKE